MAGAERGAAAAAAAHGPWPRAFVPTRRIERIFRNKEPYQFDHCQAVANASPRRHLRAGHTPASSQARAPRLLRVVAAVSRQPEDGNGGSASLAGAAAAFFC